MHDLIDTESNDEINLLKLFITLWAYKLFILSTCVLGILYGGYYALNANKQFTSEAIFKLDSDLSKNIAMGTDLSALASLAGFGIASKIQTIPTDQVTGRIFIEKLDEKLNFQTDKYFNTYNPNSVDPIWKSVIKRAIGWQKFPTNAQEAIWQGIVKKYAKNVVLNTTEEGSIKIKVTHEVPQRAAEIANVIMDTIITGRKNKKDENQDQVLFYLSNTLAKALSDLEISQSKLKEFALKNSALPLESFAAGSLELDALRDQLNRSSELLKAVAALSLMLQDRTTDQNDYLTLRQNFPIVDQVEFRRIMGQNEIISSWSWPEASSVNAVFDTLSERKTRLQSQINASQINAEQSGLALEAYAKLEREAKIAEATYTVLIEQVKAQSMAAGYRPDRTEVYEYASVSISPSAPQRSLILALGALIGLFVGVALSLFFAHLRDVYYSKESLKTGSQARLAFSIKNLLPLRNKSLSDMNTMDVKKPLSILRNMAVEIHKSTEAQVVVTSSRAKLKSNDVARALASFMQSETLKVAIIDFSSRIKKQNINEEKLLVGSFVIAEHTSHISVLTPDGNLDAMKLLSQRGFLQNIQSLDTTFDLVFLCADNEDVISLLSALEGQKMFHITLARIKKTKSATLRQMHSLLPIKGLLHD